MMMKTPMTPIEAALKDMTPWLFDRRVARLELFPDGDEIVVRAIMHHDSETDPYTHLFVGASGRGPNVTSAILNLMKFIEGHSYE
jgi:hypothetical protein